MVVVVVGCLVALAIPIVGVRLFRRARDPLERRVLTAPPAASAPAAATRDLVWLLGAQLVMAGVGAATLLSGARLFALAPIGIALELGAFVLPQLPSHSRRNKYLLLLVGAGLLAAGLGSPRGAPTPALFVFLAVPSVLMIAAVAYARAALAPDRALAADDATAARAIAWHRRTSWIQGTDFVSVVALGVMSVLGLLPAYLALRFASKARLARSPVVYLRSFGVEDAAAAFGRIVVPGVYRSASVTGLVHLAQSGHALTGALPVLWRPAFAAVENAVWQNWVTDRLDGCLAAIVDVTGATESVRWEVDEALRRLPRERVLLMRSASDVDGDPVGADLTYDLAASKEGAQRVAVWIGRVLTARHVGLGPAPVTHARWQFPIALALVLGVSLPIGVTSFASLLLVDRMQAAQTNFAKIRALELSQAVQLYRLKRGSKACPTLNDLGQSGLISSASRSRDPWDHDYVIECEADGRVRVRSPGPDGEMGTGDDVAAPR